MIGSLVGRVFGRRSSSELLFRLFGDIRRGEEKERKEKKDKKTREFLRLGRFGLGRRKKKKKKKEEGKEKKKRKRKKVEKKENKGKGQPPLQHRSFVQAVELDVESNLLTGRCTE